MKNETITTLDDKQILKHMFQEDADAQRVILVGGGQLDLQVDSNGLIEAVKDGLKEAKVELPKEKEIVQIDKIIPVVERVIEKLEVPVFIDRIKEVPVQTIVREQYTTVQKVEVPVIVKEKDVEIKVVEIPTYKNNKLDVYLQIVQIIVLLGLVISQFINK